MINLKNGALNVLKSEFIPRDPEPTFEVELQKIQTLKDERKKEQDSVKGVTEEDVQYLMEKIDKKYDPQIKENKDTIKRKKEEWHTSQTEKFVKFCFTSSLPVKFDPSASCPKIDAFFHQLQNTDDEVKRLYELRGYMLYKGYPIKKLFILYGDHDTGKTTLATELWQKRFLGVENVSTLSIQSIQDDKFDRIKLRGRYANISPELPENTYISDTGQFKLLTGNDMMSARLTHSQRELQFINFGKIIFLTNHIPRVSENADTFF
jgi:phage/plasmid-associated DNA primase